MKIMVVLKLLRAFWWTLWPTYWDQDFSHLPSWQQPGLIVINLFYKDDEINWRCQTHRIRIPIGILFWPAILSVLLLSLLR
jgi:hypothetical protein